MFFLTLSHISAHRAKYGSDVQWTEVRLMELYLPEYRDEGREMSSELWN